MAHGSLILLKMVDNPSFQCDEGDRVFSGPLQPVVNVSDIHILTWTLLKSQEEGGRYLYRLPSQEEYSYVASNGGKCRYGTEACNSIYSSDGRKLAHIDEDNHGEGVTVAVNDPRYRQRLPFGVQAIGNVWRLIDYNPKGHWDGFTVQGGSWSNGETFARAEKGYIIADNLVDACNLGFSVVREVSR